MGTSRRTFLQAGGAAALAGARPSGAARAQGAARGTAGAVAPRFQLAAHSSMFRRYRDEMFQRIRIAGYRRVELGLGHVRLAANSGEEARGLLHQISAAGLEPVSAFVVRWIADDDEEKRRKAVQEWKTAITGVRRLGLKHVGTEMTGNVAQPQAGERAFRKSMDELMPLLEDAGIHLSIEPHPGDFFEDAPSTLKLIRSLGSKNVSYLHCTPHTFYLGDSIRRVIEEAGELLSYVHLSDSFRTNRIMDRFGGGVGLHLHLQLGKGEVDFRETFESLERIGYSGVVSLQAISHNDHPVEVAAESRKYLRDLLGDKLEG